MAKKVEEKKVSLSTAIILILSVVSICGFVSLKFYQRGEVYKQQLPYMFEGEKITYFDLDGVDQSTVEASAINSGSKPKVFFLFSRPCSPCNKNIVYWNKINEVLKDDADVYGIILDNLSQAYSFTEKKAANFKIYVPQDLERFLKAMRLKLTSSQTILYSKDGIKVIKMGDLNPSDAAGFIQSVKASIKAIGNRS